MNADWGIAPPNPTSPSTFIDGTLFFQGSFNYLTMFINPDGIRRLTKVTLDGVGWNHDRLMSAPAVSTPGAEASSAQRRADP